MWKYVLGFVLFAGLSVFVLFKGGGNLDLSGEKHGIEASPAAHAAEPAASK